MRDLADSSSSPSPSTDSNSGSKKHNSNRNRAIEFSGRNIKRQRRTLRSNSTASEEEEELIITTNSSNGDEGESSAGKMIVENQHSYQEAADAAPAFVDCLRKIISSDYQLEVDEAWNSLEEMENLESGTKNSTYDCNRSYDKFLRSILTEYRINNIKEMPKLLEWFSKFPFPNTKTNPISHDIARFFINSARDFKDQPYLADIIQVLNDNHEKYLLANCDHSCLCEAIVEVLSWMKVPETTAEIKKYNKDLTLISDFLKKKNFGIENSNFMCLKKLGNILLKSDRTEDPNSALLIVIQLINEELWKGHMEVLVNEIIQEIQDECKIIKMLCLFCRWLTLPPYNNMDYLSTWLNLFMNSLISKGKRRIAFEVANEMLPVIFSTCTRLPAFYSINPDDNIIFFLLEKVTSQDLHHKMMRLICNYFEDDKIPPHPNEKLIRETIVRHTIKLLCMFESHLQNPGNPCAICEKVQKVICARGLNNDLIYVVEEKEVISYPSTSSGIGRIDTDKTGLNNLGNTCYMNSVLQALAMTRSFTHEVLLYKNTDLSNQTVLKDLQNLLALLKYSGKKSLAPQEFWRSAKPAQFTVGTQQDSSEFLCHLLDVLYEEEKSALLNVNNSDQYSSAKSKEEKEVMEVEEEEASGILESPKNDDDSPKVMARWTTEENLSEGVSLQRKTQSLADFTKGEELAQTQNGLSDSHSDSTDSGIQSVGGEETSTISPYLVHRVFGGELKITYRCLQCDTESHNTDQFRELQLCFLDTLIGPDLITVQDLINSNYSMPEELSGDNKYRCDNCANLCNAQRIMKILQAPAHLILTLKHFRYDSNTGLRTKWRHKVIYNETIKLPVYTSLYQDNETYQLYAAVVHSGLSIDYGHYITYACDARNRWYKFNDNIVSETRLDELKQLVVPDTPYILFYRRCGRQNEPDEDAPDFASLSETLQEYIEKDKRNPMEERRITRLSASGNSASRYNSTNFYNNDDDEDNPPPSKCRDAVNIPSGHFLC